MARRRGMGLSPIDSVKHIVQQEATTTTSTNVRNIVVADVVARGTTRTNAFDIWEGAKLFQCYIELWLNGLGSTNPAKFQLVIMKLTAGQTPPTFTEMSNLTSYEGKKNILFTSQGIVGAAGNQSIPILRDWYKIPKGKQRFSIGDSVNVILAVTNESVQSCGLVIFKEYL